MFVDNRPEQLSGVDEFKNEYKDICKKIVEKVKSY